MCRISAAAIPNALSTHSKLAITPRKMNDFAAGSSRKSTNSRLPPEVNRILYVRNLPFKITAEELYDIFGKYGAVYQIRLGERSKDTRGTAFVGEYYA